MLLTLSHVPCMCCMSHGGCVVITLHVSYFAALFLWISHLMLLVLQLFSSMSYIPFKHFGKLCPFLLWHYYLSFFKHTFPYFFFQLSGAGSYFITLLPFSPVHLMINLLPDSMKISGSERKPVGLKWVWLTMTPIAVRTCHESDGDFVCKFIFCAG